MKIVTIVGARPQFIKASTVSRVISSLSYIKEILVHTGQHFDTNMSDVFFEELDIKKPDYKLGIGGGTHGQNTGRMIEAIESVLLRESPDWVLVYGDTDSTLAGALSAAKLHIPVAHVEAGLRSFNRLMPEEINRILTDHSAVLLFAPTQSAVTNLKLEGILGEKVCLVGDVMFDATIFYRDRAQKPDSVNLEDKNTFILSTVHRAENTDNPERLIAIVALLNQLAQYTNVVLPLHPRTFNAIRKLDGPTLSPSVNVIEPVGYLEMTWLLANCNLVMTDSGGLQKEAYFHNKPCLTLRDETEWVELVEAGFNRTLSPFSSDIISNYNEMCKVKVAYDFGLFGNGNAAMNIVNSITQNS
jgi:UDP-GlcNAc3NAcA epimerase